MIVELDRGLRARHPRTRHADHHLAGAVAHFSAGHDLGSPDEIEDQKAHPVGPASRRT